MCLALVLLFYNAMSKQSLMKKETELDMDGHFQEGIQNFGRCELKICLHVEV